MNGGGLCQTALESTGKADQSGSEQHQGRGLGNSGRSAERSGLEGHDTSGIGRKEKLELCGIEVGVRSNQRAATNAVVELASEGAGDGVESQREQGASAAKGEGGASGNVAGVVDGRGDGSGLTRGEQGGEITHDGVGCADIDGVGVEDELSASVLD